MLTGHDHAVQEKGIGGRLAMGAGRIMRHRRACATAAAAAVLAAAGVTGVSAVAAAQSAPAACASGYFCLALSPAGTGNVALVAAGQQQAFASPGLPVTQLVNNTTTFTCLFVRYSNGAETLEGVPVGYDSTVSYSVLDIFPGPTC
jgi:hypothetical protein